MLSKTTLKNLSDFVRNNIRKKHIPLLIFIFCGLVISVLTRNYLNEPLGFLCFFAIAALLARGQKWALRIACVLYALVIGVIIFNGAIYANTYGELMDRHAFRAIWETDSSIHYQYIDNYILTAILGNFQGTVTAVLYLLFIVSGFFLPKMKKTVRLSPKAITVVLVICFGVLYMLSSKQDILPADCVHSYLRHNRELNELRGIIASYDKNTLQGVKAIPKGEVHVIIMGESANLNHMSSYGYARNTCQFTQDIPFIRFDNAISPHTHTNPVWRLAFTTRTVESNNNNTILLSSILKTAGAKTIWFSNQPEIGRVDNETTAIAHTADKTVFLKKLFTKTDTEQNSSSRYFDDKLLDCLAEELSAKSKDETLVVFLHIMGSHGRYFQRYPKSDEVFKGKVPRGFFGDALKPENNDIVNAYDNSIRYTDKFIAKTVEMLEKQGGVSSLTYLSDHSEATVQNLGHAVGMHYTMYQIPFMCWFSDEYKSQYPQAPKAASNNRHTPFVTDDLFHSILDLTHVSCPQLDPTRSVFNENFDPPQKRVVLKGDFDQRPEGVIQARNHLKQLDRSIYTKVMAHHVNTIAKLQQTNFSGFAGAEVDIMFMDNRGFQIGHGQEDLMGITLQQYLQCNTNKNLRFWFDIKNIDENNIDGAFDTLLALSSKYDLKNPLMETSYTGEKISRYTDKLNISYYLPTAKLKPALKANDQKLIEKYVIEIAAQINRQKIRAISFDDRFYPIALKIQQACGRKLELHLWDLDMKSHREDFAPNLSSSDYSQNSDVKSILVTLESEYN